MAKGRKAAAETRDDCAACLAASLPADRDGLLAVAADAVTALNAAILAADDGAAELAAERYDAAVWKLNGGTFFANRDITKSDAGGTLVEAHCRAEPGIAPMWGQSGEFLVTVSGISAVVEIGDGFGRFMVSMEFHVVDPQMPFISATGYRSHFEKYRGGQTLEQAAITVFAAYLAKERRPLSAEHCRRRALVPARAWLAELPQPRAVELVFEEAGGQMAFGF